MPLLSNARHAGSVAVLLALLLGGAWAAFAPGLSGPFLLDDFDNLAALDRGVEDWDGVKQYLSIGNAGPLGRPVAKLSFLLDDNNWPSNPYLFKTTNLLIHLLVGLLVFVVLRSVARYKLPERTSDWVALAATAIWLVHPMQVSTVLYVVQRMTQLSTLFVLAGVAVHLSLRRRYPDPTLGQLFAISVSIGFFGLLALLSKESGALLPVFIAIVEITILSPPARNQWFLWWRRLVLFLPTISILIYVFYIPRWIDGYANRDFSLAERLLTQIVVLWDYLGSLFSLRVHQLGLFQDDYTIYSSLWSPAVLIGLLGIVALIAFSLFARRVYPLICFGILWFFAGHIIESSAVSLELYFEHRNYLPFVGPIFAFVVGVYLAVCRFAQTLFNFQFIFLGLLIAIVGSITWGYSSEWGDTGRIIPIWASEHPNSLRAQRTFAHFLASEGFPDAALRVIDDTYQDFPEDLSLPLMSLSFSCAYEKPIRYDMTTLRSEVGEHRWTDGLRPVVSNLSDFIQKTSCGLLAPDVAKVLGETTVFMGRGTNRSGVASLLVIAGDLMLGSGKADEALEFYFQVDEITPSPDSASRIFGVYIRAGRFELARRWLEVAIERDAKNGISESQMAEYERYFNFVDERLN